MKFYKLKYYMMIGLISSTFLACMDDSKDSNQNVSVDQTSFLANLSSFIVEDYNQLNNSVNDLVQAIDSLEKNTDQRNLNLAQEALKVAWLDWQSVSHLEFGPAESSSLKSELNIFKTDTAQIEASISSGNYNLDQISMKDAKGFPAVDYLLNGKVDLETMKAFKAYTNRCVFLKAVVLNMQSKINKVTTDWNSYRNSFSANTGTDVGSSTGMLINALNQHVEKHFRDNKIGIPLGVRSSGIQRPDFVEAAYGQYSVDLAIANFDAIRKIYLGNNGYGLDDYLEASNASDLNKLIQDQMSVIDLKLNDLSNPLANQISTNPNKVQLTYNEIQKLIVLLKVDMPSRMGVLITYQDNDGD